MNFAQTRQFDVANGLGIRSTVFLSGCKFNCKNCFNVEYQNFSYGKEFTKEEQQKFINLGKHEYVKGYSILGGEPLQQDSEQLYDFLCEIKRQTGKTIWMWTGYRFENIPKQYHKCLEHIDVLVDGQFVQELKDLSLKFKGSSNQRVIDVQKTIEQNKVVLFLKD